MNAQIIGNVLKFLERVQVTGAEAFAWCEAYAYLQAELNKPATPSKDIQDGSE